ncbi:MAG: transglycosylase domain-containing protein [Actinomyces sp.]|jgi:membrane peptidoglycan carboxypeptidase|nr:transglycosylase domain-containing protein [Actinomyces sp.]MCI1641819.1 transglycosylase domain-containing protein [Actinomyces sp.]MCI1661998.1 transglycosylase domain-containing protein [Actinomyces sp.]MCI1690802.1 transglycosylase domain-containing protein [Actinomyces sp.]MCI1787300.1 transglycosylase domain-containing protein [Actinomyces sp.]MCI1829694.1 transglycosylase domain-containing protein [Actinomyces sp.]
MSSPRSRAVTPVQLVALLLAFLSISGLTGVLGAGLLVPAAGSAGEVAKAVPTVFDGLPDDLQIVEPAVESTMLDEDGNTIATFFDKRRIVVPSDKIADIMKQAIVAIEDKRFYEHHGVDPDGVARALVSNLSGDSGTQGASTITQQYIRNMLIEKGYLEGDAQIVADATAQTPERKLREMKYALTLETKMSKDEILTGYLNIAPFGPTTYGVEAASKLYFSKSASQLTISEAALLAGLVQAPTDYDPLTYPDAAQSRRDTVLGVMLDQGVITQGDYDAAVAVNVSDMLHPDVQTSGCSGATTTMEYFCQYAIEQFLNDETFGATQGERNQLLQTGGIEIRTTINASKQQDAWNALTAALPVDNANGGVGLDDALTSVEPSTGNVLAMAQNTTYGQGESTRETMVNYNVDSNFSPGSTFKLFTLIQWFKEGHGAYDTVGRANRTYTTGEFTCSDGTYVPVDNGAWTVNDLTGKDGPMQAIRALGLSVNQAFINMSTKVDFCAIFQDAKDFGITKADGSAIDPLPSNIIGSGEASPLKLATAYAAIANNGVLCQPNAITTVTDRDGNVLKEYKPNCSQVLDSTVAQKVSTMLRKANAQYYDFALDGGRQFAAKTGTTDNNSNTWTAGFTQEIATVAWMGYANSSSQQVENFSIAGTTLAVPYGSTVGAYIWAPYMNAALAGTTGTPMADVFIGDVPRPSPSPTPSATDTGSSSDKPDTDTGDNGQGQDNGGDSGSDGNDR